MKHYSNSDYEIDQFDDQENNVYQDVYDTGFDDGYIKANQENLIANQYKKPTTSYQTKDNTSLYTQSRTELEDLKNQSNRVNSDIDYYEQLQVEIGNEKNRLLAALDELEANQHQFHPEDFEAEREYLLNELDRLENELYHVEQYKNDSIDFVNELNERLKKEQTSLDHYNKDHDKNIRSNYIQIDELKSKLFNESKQYKDLLASSSNEIKELDNQINELQYWIDQKLHQLNADSYGTHKLDNLSRQLLQDEINDLVAKKAKLQSAKKIHLYNINLKKETIKRYKTQLDQYLNSLKEMKKEHDNKYKGYVNSLDTLKNEVEKAKQNFDDQKGKIFQIKASADQYFALRKIELENSYKKAKQAILQAKQSNAQTAQQRELLTEKQNKTKRLLIKLQEDKDRLKIANLSFESMRKQSLAALNNLQNELKQKFSFVENRRKEQDLIVNEKINELEEYKSELKDERLKFEREKETQERKYKNAELALNKKRQEIDELFLEANAKLSEASRKEDDLHDKKQDILAKLRNLEQLKAEIDQRKKALDQKELLDQQTIQKIQLEVESERADLQRMLLIERKKNDEREQELLQYERDIKRQQTDFENNISWEQKKLVDREKELKEGYEQLQIKQAEVQAKINQLNEEISKAQTSKQNSFVLEQKLKNDLNNLNTTKAYLNKQQEDLNLKSQKMIEDLKVFEHDLKRQKEDLSIYEKNLQKKEASLANYEHDINTQKNEAFHKAQAMHQELELKKALVENELKKLSTERQQLDLDKEDSLKKREEIDQEIKQLAKQRNDLEIYQNNIENFKANSIEKLNIFEAELAKKRSELESLKTKQENEYNALNQKLNDELNELEQQKKKFATQKQQKLEELIDAQNQLKLKENDLAIYAQKVNDRYNELKTIENNNKASKQEIEAKLVEFKQAQVEFLKQSDKIAQEQIKFDNRVELLESEYNQRSEILSLREEDYKKRKFEQEEQEERIKKDFKRLEEEKNNFDELKRNKFNKISNLYLEIQKQRNEIELSQKNINEQRETLFNQARDGRLQKQEINDKLEQLEKADKKFHLQEELLAKKRIDLIQRIGTLKAEINQKHEILSLRSVQLNEVAKQQQQKDADLQRKFDLLEAEKDQFNHDKQVEFEKLKKERNDLLEKEKDVNKNINQLNLAIAKLDLIRKTNKADKSQINNQLALLNERKEKIDRENEQLDAKKTEFITRLKRMENDLEAQKQQVLLDRSNVDRMMSDQQALSRELEQKYRTLQQEKRNFSEQKENDLREIDNFYQQVQQKDRNLSHKIEDLKQLRYVIDKESSNVNANKKELKQRIDEYHKLHKAILADKRKLDSQKTNFFNKVELLKQELHKKSSKIEVLRSKVFNNYKDQQREKQVLAEQKYKNNQLRQSLLKTQQELHKERDDFNVAKNIELKKLNFEKAQINEKLNRITKEKHKVATIKQEVDFRKQELENLQQLIAKQKSELQKALNENSENAQRLQDAQRLINEQKQRLKSEYAKAKKILANAKTTDEKHKQQEQQIQNQFKKLVQVNKKMVQARNNLLKQRTLIQEAINKNTMANFQNPYPNFLNITPATPTQTAPNQIIVPVQAPAPFVGMPAYPQVSYDMNNPLMQMHQLINQQQMFMMQKEHQWALDEANKKNNKLSKQLKQLKNHKKLLAQNASQHLNYHNQLNANNSYKINSLHNLLNQVAFNTEKRIKRLENELEHNQQNVRELEEISSNSRLLEEIKNVLNDTKQSNLAPISNSNQTNELKELVNEIKSDFKNQMNLFSSQKQELKEQFDQLSDALQKSPQEVKRAIENQDKKYQQMFDNLRHSYEQNINLLRTENQDFQKQLSGLYDEIHTIKSNTEKIKVTPPPVVSSQPTNQIKENLDLINQAQAIIDQRKKVVDQKLNQNLRIDLNHNKETVNHKKERINQLANEIKTIKELIEKKKAK
ncbi:cytadherence high molecular weight protein 2 [Mycoplasma sp. E35C]|uniref:cytadherence high molecular weight protein 2 n=1 Tax=Mycoplasma sp. E35C TaxID=2801918 RepID=UPI001CA3F895|nr:cytadherence high molecular weight protein 2 [Mycoplasma sp. E35C]QZX49419.1 cytadherence high molecular weight protein 2 [Mycoplasma sp. E35C]